MIGHSFMSNKINLPGSASSSAARPANAPTKPFGSAAQNGARSQQPTPQAKVKPEPEPVIELPDVDSEYSDSEDEDAQEAKRAALPRWAQSPNLARALELQQTINPDEIFGPIPKLSIRGALVPSLQPTSTADLVLFPPRNVPQRRVGCPSPRAHVVCALGGNGRAHAGRHGAVPACDGLCAHRDPASSSAVNPSPFCAVLTRLHYYSAALPRR
jgi:hypothetical protein